MKKLFAFVCMLLMSTAMFAQNESMALGVNLNYGVSSDYKPFGVGARFQYEFIENVRGEALVNYYFPKDDSSVLDANINFQYLFGIGEKMNFYPVAGLSLINMMVTGDTKKALDVLGADTSKFLVGFNVGVGFEYKFTSNLKGLVEVKYQYAKSDGWKIDWEPIQLGVAYVF
ncbi:MAG: porin family protein [Prevotella sp.]|nr:porin family protein [Prevotella sp.]